MGIECMHIYYKFVLELQILHDIVYIHWNWSCPHRWGSIHDGIWYRLCLVPCICIFKLHVYDGDGILSADEAPSHSEPCIRYLSAAITLFACVSACILHTYYNGADPIQNIRIEHRSTWHIMHTTWHATLSKNSQVMRISRMYSRLTHCTCTTLFEYSWV